MADRKEREQLFSPFWTVFWSIVLGWCVTWPIGTIFAHAAEGPPTPLSIALSVCVFLIIFPGWVGVSIFIWRNLND